MSGQKQALLAIAIVVTAFGFWVRSRCVTSAGVDLRPRPDALEYGLAAESLVTRGTLAMSIGGADYPPRYPPGFPLLVAPVTALAGLAGTWVAALCYGLLGVFLVCLLGFLLDGLVVAGIAGLVAAVSPELVRSAVVAMSETASLALWTATLVLLALAARGRSRRTGRLALLGAGALIGVSVTVRYTNLALLLPALLFFGTRHRFAPPSLLRATGLIAGPALLGVAAVLLYNRATFGSPWQDGYRFWAPHIYNDPFILFNPRYLLEGLPGYWETGHLEAYARAMSGLDGVIATPVVFGLAILGAIRTLARSRVCPVARVLTLVLFTAAPAVLCFHLVYAWQSIRFLVPLAPLLAVLCGSGVRAVAALVARAPGAAGRVGAVLATALLALAAIGPLALPLESQVFPRSKVPPPPALLSVLSGLDRELERHSIVIVNFPVSLAELALGRDREIVVTDATAADPHLNFVFQYHMKGRGGRTPETVSLAILDQPQQESLRHVMLFVRERRPVYYVYSAGEAPGGAGIQELDEQALLIESLARPPLTVFRVEPRD